MDRRRCQARSPRERYQCTQEESHRGNHTALQETGVEYTPERIKR